MVENSLLEESKMLDYMLDKESLPAYWLDTGNVVVSSEVDDVMEGDLLPDDFGLSSTEPELLAPGVMDLDFLLNTEIIEPKGMGHLQSEPESTISKNAGTTSSMEISRAEDRNPNAAQEALELECAKVKLTSAQLSANECKCPQCGRFFKNASALHNHTRRGTKCKSGEEQNPPKGIETKVKQSGNRQSSSKWSKGSASGSFEGVQSLKSGVDPIGGAKDSNFSQTWKQRESGDLNCLDCPGLMFKNNTSLKVHQRGHRSRERVSENMKVAASELPGSSSNHLPVRTSPAPAFLAKPSTVSNLQLPFTTTVLPRMQLSVSRETSTVEAKTVILNPKPSLPVQSKKNAFSAPPPSLREDRDSIKAETKMQTTKTG